MNFKQAEDRLTELAPGRYRGVEYMITIMHTGNKIQECRLYVDGPGYMTANTWDKAFELMENAINKTPIGASIPPETVEEFPDEQADIITKTDVE